MHHIYYSKVTLVRTIFSTIDSIMYGIHYRRLFSYGYELTKTRSSPVPYVFKQEGPGMLQDMRALDDSQLVQRTESRVASSGLVVKHRIMWVFNWPLFQLMKERQE